MTDEQINPKIAELCGWNFCPPFELSPDAPNYHKWKAEAVLCWVKPGNGNWQTERLPNYTADLNACHEFEKTLGDIDNWLLYDRALAEIAEGFTFHATARQRCEAFLRVHGQWEDEA